MTDHDEAHPDAGRPARQFIATIAAARHREPRSRWRILAILTLVGLVVRVYQLGAHGLSLEEVITAQSVRYETLGDVVGWAEIWADKTPLLFVLTWLLRPLGGDEVAVRLPMVIAGSLTVPALYYLGRELSTWRAGMAAAAAVAIAPFAVSYSQELQSYALLMLFVTLQMLFAYRVAVNAGRLDWLWLALTTILSLYSSPLAVVSTLAAFGFIAVIEMSDRGTGSPVPRAWAPGVAGDRRIRFAALALLVSIVACLPLVPKLARSVTSGDLGFARVGGGPPLSTDGSVALLSALDVRGVVALLVLLGLTMALVHTVRDRDPGSLLVLIWIGVPVAAYLMGVGAGLVTISPPFFAILYPALLLLAVDGLFAVARSAANAVASLAKPSRQPGFESPAARLIVTGAIVSVIGLLVLSDWVPAVARSYVTPAGDASRDVVDSIIRDAKPGTTVVALGENRYGLLLTLGYYLSLRGSTLPIVDSEEIDDAGQGRLQDPGDLYAVIPDGAAVTPAEPPAGARLARFPGATVVRFSDDGTTQLERLGSILQWADGLDPSIAQSRELIDLLRSAADRPGNLLAGARPIRTEGDSDVQGAWRLPPGDSTFSEDHMDVVPTDGEANATITARVRPGGRYAVTFGCRGTPGSNARVYVTEGSVSDLGRGVGPITVFPNGAGYRCMDDGSWRAGGFVFEIGPGIHDITIWLRAAAPTASFRDVRLDALP